MKNFSDYIPAKIQEFSNVKKLISVLDNLNTYKELGEFPVQDSLPSVKPIVYGISRVNDSFDFRRLYDDVNFLKKFLYQLGQIESVPGFPPIVLNNLIKNSWDIFAQRGTVDGLRLYFSCFLGDAQVNPTTSYANGRFINLSDYIVLAGGSTQGDGFLPSGSDLGSSNVSSNNFLGLFTTFSDYYTSIEIRVSSPYGHIPELRNFWEEILPLYLPMIDINTSTVTVKVYSHFILQEGYLFYSDNI